MAGLAGMAQGNMNQALSGLARAADLEEARKNAGMQMKRAFRQQQVGGTMSGAAAGATIGSTWGAPGAIIGGIIGALAGYGTSTYAG